MNIIALFSAIAGSWLMVKGQHRNAARMFTIGNILNFMVGIMVGNLALCFTMIGFTYYTTMLLTDTDRIVTGFFGASLFPFAKPAPDVFFQMDLIGLLATIMALYGSKCMVEGNIRMMCWMWILADLLFLYIGITTGLVGLAVQSIIFVYYSIIRLNGWELTGVISFRKPV